MHQLALIPGQNLLYTLFEAPSNQRLPVLVIGLTECFELVSLLEKRVKSRFSQHVIGAADSVLHFEDYVSVLKEALTDETQAKAYNQSVRTAFDSAKVQAALRPYFQETTCIHGVLSRLVSAIPDVLPRGFRLRIEDVCLSLGTLAPESMDLTGASFPVLSLLVAIHRYKSKHLGQHGISFEAIMRECDEMRKQADQQGVAQSFTISRETYQLAWNTLQESGLVARSPASWLDQDADACALAEPLTNLCEHLPKDQTVLRQLASLD